MTVTMISAEVRQMVQTPIKPASQTTLESFLQLPETKPASEYIDGEISQKPMPQGEHSTLQRDLLFKIDFTLKPNKIARAFPELLCTFGDRAIVPDVTVFRDDRIPRKENGGIANVFALAPDWTIEILSPDQSDKKVIDKIMHCLDHGCEMGWMIYPEDREVMVYPHNDRSRRFNDPEAILPVPDWAKGLELTVGELFGWLSA
jgi:Uma2 family endonuclease